MNNAAKAKKILDESKVIDSKGQADTLRVWESYRDQALLWRALALIQIPATAAAIAFSIVLWTTRSITLNVPLKPAPGVYQVQEIADVEFIEVATEFINLIATYQPAIAQRQFREAKNMLWEPFLTEFNTDMIGTELQSIQNTQRTQLFFIDPTKTKITRNGNEVVVSFTGDRLKLVAGKELPVQTSRYTVTLKTIPRNKTNPYGITITNVTFENVQR